MANFKVGQKVVCVESHPEGGLKEGDVYVVTGIFPPRCKCEMIHPFLLSVNNILNPNWFNAPNTLCHCGKINPAVQQSRFNLFRPSRFRPLQYTSASFELASTFIEVKETSDRPINVPEKQTA